MSTYVARLSELRALLAQRGFEGFVLPRTDEHLSEYVGEYAKRLAWLTGFTGSAGTAVVLSGSAAIFIDGRYTLQAREQVGAGHWSHQEIPLSSVESWLSENAKPGATIAYDPWLHTQGWVESVESVVAARGIKLVAVEPNPIDEIWKDRPEASRAAVIIHPETYAGRSGEEKRREVGAWLARNNSDATILCALDSIAWLFNVRGKDVSRTPVARAYAVVRANGSAEIFIEPEKVGQDVVRHLGSEVAIRPRSEFQKALSELHDKRISLDPDRTPAAIYQRLRDGKAHLVEARDPVVITKAKKNAREIVGAQAAHVRDGVAVTRFLHWLEKAGGGRGEDEISAAAKLLQLRRDGEAFQDLSFETISAAGPSAASPHYHAAAGSARSLERNSLYLCDSGAQYLDGTTDITRTVVLGQPTEEMRDRFTRVLRGNIALSMAVFPEGTSGAQLDVLARQYLWEAGLDYDHGTGHGVGSYLAVHEGPQRINRRRGEEPLVAGMIVSNEPGYYKANAYGIRIENLMLIEERCLPGGERSMLGFRVLTLAPIDRRLIRTAMLRREERAWLDDYHSRVHCELARFLPDETRAWLADVTQPLVRAVP